MPALLRLISLSNNGCAIRERPAAGLEGERIRAVITARSVIIAGEMSFDWSKFVPAGIGILSYLGGLATKPFERWYTSWSDRRKLEKALYAEINANYSHMVALFLSMKSAEALGSPPSEYPKPSQWIAQHAYDDAKKTPLLFYELQEHKLIGDFYRMLDVFKGLEGDDKRLVERVLNVIHGIAALKKEGKFTRVNPLPKAAAKLAPSPAPPAP